MTRRARPSDGAPPSHLWHEAHPGRPDVPRIRICHHPVVRVTARFVYVQRTCPPWNCTAKPYGPVRLSREDLARGEGAAAWVADKDAKRHNAYNTRAWFFEGDVPAEPHRPPAWFQCREYMRRMWERHEREARASRGQSPCDEWINGRVCAEGPALIGELAALGLDAMPADLDALKRAWRATAKRTHPDVEGGDAAEFAAARAAYELLAAALQPQGAV